MLSGRLPWREGLGQTVVSENPNFRLFWRDAFMFWWGHRCPSLPGGHLERAAMSVMFTTAKGHLKQISGSLTRKPSDAAEPSIHSSDAARSLPLYPLPTHWAVSIHSCPSLTYPWPLNMLKLPLIMMKSTYMQIILNSHASQNNQTIMHKNQFELPWLNANTS